jgi:hypothetical protein
MYGVPANLNLRRFHGATLTQICLGEFQQQFHFIQPELSISVEGDWLVQSESGEVIDKSAPNSERTAYRIHRLLGKKVTDHNLNAPTSFSLLFENGLSLFVFDNSDRYESFSIQPGDIFV